MSSVCRLCAGKSDGIAIFDNPEERYFPYKINFTLNVKVDESDDRLTVCHVCRLKVNEFHDFKHMVRTTEEQGIGSEKVKIKEEPNDFKDIKVKEEPVDFHELAKHIKIVKSGDAAPMKVLALPFTLVPSEESLSSMESSVDDLINEVNTDPEDGAPPDSPAPHADASNADSNDANFHSDAPITDAPITDAPVTDAPVTDAPVTNAPESDSNDSDSNAGKKRKCQSPDTVPKRRRKCKVAAAPVEARRSTRSSTGVLPRKKIIDEVSDEESVDDPDYKVQGESEQDSGDESDQVNHPNLSIKKIPEKPPVEGTCVKCEKLFPTTMALESHQMEEHNNETWYCYDCLCGFPNFKTWKYHKRNFCKKSAVIRICTLCHESFKSYDELKAHAESCNKTPPKDSKPIIIKNSDSTNDKPTFRCSFCSIETDDNAEFLEHLKVHKKNVGSVLKCNHCDLTFKEKGALICHKEFHHKTNQLNSSASNKNVSDNHTKSDKLAKADNLTCQTDMGVVSRKYNKEYKCSTCNETFENSGKLICHQVLAHKKK